MIVDVTPRVLFVNKQSISVHPNSMLFLHLKKENRFKKIQSTLKEITTAVK
jgi:hypothetical protein